MFAAIAIITLPNCTKTEEESPEDLSYRGISILPTNDSEFEYIANDKEGNMVFYDWESNYVKKAVCRDKIGNWVEMHFDEQGYPDYVCSEDYIVIIKNIANKKADFAVIELSSDKINIFREVDFDLGEYNLNKSIGNFNNQEITLGWYGDVAEGLKFASTALTAFTVVTAIIGVSTANPAVIALSGVSLVLGVIASVSSEYFEELEASSLAYSIGAAAIGCGSGDNIACVGLGVTITAEVFEIIEDNQNDISVVESALVYGYGDVQVTLTWDNIADLDLHVIDPNGEEIYWEHKYSSSNGVLDVDDIDGYGPENIYWPEYEAPSGNFEVFVHMYPWDESEYIAYTGNSYYPSNSNYTILVNAFGQTKKFTGSISFDETINIITFNQNGLKSANLKSISNITKKNKKKR